MDFINPLSFLMITGFLCLVVLVLLWILRYYYKLSVTDEITSIDNYRQLRKAIPKIMASQRKSNLPCALAILDIDQFRNFNYVSYAHGDIVLLEFVNFIKQTIPVDAYMARFRSGDEFIILLKSNCQTATEILGNIQEECNAKLFMDETRHLEFNIRFSYGCTPMEKENDNLLFMIEKAEKALRESKEKLRH
jgi:diguanylate cyclase (GGDEF)-like protein